ncbi:hypothetical protein ACE6H2_019765 [Prunus campanulata]
MAPDPVTSHLAKLKKAMDESQNQPKESFAVRHQENLFVLGPLYLLQPPDDVVVIWAEQHDDQPPYKMKFEWSKTWEKIRPIKGWPNVPISNAVTTAGTKSKVKKNNPGGDPKRDWYDWFKALEPKLKTFWHKIGIYDALALCATGTFPCDRSLLIASLCFWSCSTNCMKLRFGMMTPTLLDLAAIAGLRPHGKDYSAAGLPKSTSKLSYSRTNKYFSNWVETYFRFAKSSSGAPRNGVSYEEHVAFLQMWLCKFLTCSKSGQITQEVQSLAEVLANGETVALGPIFLAYLYRGLHQMVSPNPVSCNVSGPIWLFQLWLHIYFPELGPSEVTFQSDTLLGLPIAQLPLQKHHVEDCFDFFYECSERSPNDFSICLDRRYPSYLAMDLATPATLENRKERQELWASILINRDLPHGLVVGEGSQYHCGCEIYYPAAVGRQLGFIQGVPAPMIDSLNHFSSWRVSFKKKDEVISLVNDNRELAAPFVFPTRDPQFGFTDFFKPWWERMSSTWFSLPFKADTAGIFQGCPCSSSYNQWKTARAKEMGSIALADSSSNQGEKRALSSDSGTAEDGHLSNHDIEFPPADNISLARPRKTRKNPHPTGLGVEDSIRLVELPNQFHSTAIAQSAVSSSIAPDSHASTLELDLGGLITTSSHGVANEVAVDDMGGVCRAALTFGHSTTGAYHEATQGTGFGCGNTPAAQPAIEIELPASLNSISSPQRNPTDYFMETGTEGRPPQAVEDIFAYLDQWAASTSKNDASTRLATSSLTFGMLRDPGAEALVRAYLDRDYTSFADETERARLKTSLDNLAASGFFPGRITTKAITHLFEEAEKKIVRYSIAQAELEAGRALKHKVSSASAVIMRRVELGRKKQQEVLSIDGEVERSRDKIKQLQDQVEQIQKLIEQLEEKRNAIITQVSEDVRNHRSLQAQLQQDSEVARWFGEDETSLLAIIADGNRAWENFTGSLRDFFPNA